MSAKYIDHIDNGDVRIKFSVEDRIVIVLVSQEAIEDCKYKNVEKFSDFSAKKREALMANILVYLVETEASGNLKSEYKILGRELNYFLGE